jgi:O-antigen/teichoic acid export membrane protein
MSGATAGRGTDPRRRPLLARIAGNFAWGMVAEMSAKGALFLVTLRLAGVLGAENFGEFSFLQTVFIFLWMGVDLGLNMYATREVARNPDDVARLLADLTAMRLGLALALGGLALAGFSMRSDPATTYLTAGFALYLVVRAVQPDWLLRGLERYRALALVNIATAVLQLAVTWLLIDGPEDYALSSLPWFVSYLVGTGGVVLALRHAGIPVWRRGDWSGPRGWWRHWSESIHFTLSSGVSTLYQNLPLLYLYWQGTAQQTGLFAAPFRLVIALLFVASVFPMTLYPVIADLEARGRGRALARLIGAAALATTVAAGIVGAMTAIWAESIVTMLYGAEYLAGAQSLRWLSLFLLLRSVRAVFVRVVGGMGHQRRCSAVSIASVAALLALLGCFSWLGIDPLVGAPVALAVTEAVVLLSMVALTMSVLRAMPPEGRPAG